MGFTSIVSVLDKVDEKININIIHNSKNIYKSIPNYIKNHQNLNAINIHIFQNEKYMFPNLENSHVSEATYFRLFIEDYIESSNECHDYFTNLCEPDILLFDLRYLVNSSHIVHTNYPLELSNDAGYVVEVNNSSDCLDYAKKGFRFKSIYMNKVRIPWINLVYLIFAILSLYQINKMFRNEIDTN